MTGSCDVGDPGELLCIVSSRRSNDRTRLSRVVAVADGDGSTEVVVDDLE
jgi:hypothetical protein